MSLVYVQSAYKVKSVKNAMAFGNSSFGLTWSSGICVQVMGGKALRMNRTCVASFLYVEY